jgi:hypothetical protein
MVVSVLFKRANVEKIASVDTTALVEAIAPASRVSLDYLN